jgi:short-subunit dehydrogenase
MSTTSQGKVVLIVGASSGIGAALAQEFAARGAHLVLAARRLDRLKNLQTQLADELKKNGTRSLVYACDVTRDGDLEALTQAALQEFGRIDCVIANAGFGVAGKLEKLKLEDYRRQFETNVFGVLRTIYATLDELKKSRGTLALLGSVAGSISLPGSSPYTMSKFSIHALARSITPELKQHGISVVHIAPGFVESEIRQVDNQGRYQPDSLDSKDDIPKWLVMPTSIAAQKIADAIERRKEERIITAHGYWAVWLNRHFPWLISYFVNRGLSGRQEPKKERKSGA